MNYKIKYKRIDTKVEGYFAEIKKYKGLGYKFIDLVDDEIALMFFEEKEELRPETVINKI